MFNQTRQQITTAPATAHSLLAFCLLLICLLPTSTFAVPSTWQWGHPNPHGVQNNAVIWGDNEYIAVGEGGSVIRSADGAVDTWILQDSTTSLTLNDIAWNGRRYVSVGNQGAMISSEDGTTWQVRTAGTTNKLTDVIWNGEFFLAIGEYTAVVDDPINGSISRPAATILTSKNPNDNTDTGITWTLETALLNPDRYSNIPPPRLRGITWDGTHFVASSDNGAILTSTDGVAWYTRTIKSMAWNGTNLYLAIVDNGLVLTSPDGTNWTVRTPSVTNNPGLGTLFSGNFQDVVWGNGRFVMVGDNGIVLSSLFGITWTSETTGTSETLRSITYGAASFITVGDNGTIMYRDHLPTTTLWLTQTSGVTENLYGVALTGNAVSPPTVVAVGNNGTILNSLTLTTWAKASDLPTSFSTDLLNVSWSAQRFIATGKDGTLLTAANDGDIWTEQTSGTTEEWLFDSTTVITPIVPTTDPERYNITDVIVGTHGTVITRLDTGENIGTAMAPNVKRDDTGNPWVMQSTPTDETLMSITTDGTKTLIGGEYATQIKTSDPNNIVASDLNINTPSIPSGRITQQHLNDILYANNKYTTVGNTGTILTSDDAIYWEDQSSAYDTNDLLSITNKDNTLVAAGKWGELRRSVDNGSSWSNSTPPSPFANPNPSTGTTDFLFDITTRTSTSSMTAVGSGGAIFASPDEGANWALTAGPTKTRQNINGLTASDSLLVAVGDNGVILNSSNDGVDWVRQTAAPEYPSIFPTATCTTSHLRDVAWKPTAPSRFVAVGDDGAVCISIDGSDWTTTTSSNPPDSSSTLYAITWGDNQFVAVGGSTVNSVVYTSPDGDVWTPRNSNEPFVLRDIAWNNGRFIAVGDGGTITTSPKGIAWTRNSSGTTVNLKTIAIGTETIVVTGTTTSPLRTTVLRNVDGTWQGGADDVTLDDVEINDLSFGGTQFAGVGPSGTIVVSEDGLAWTAISTGTNSLFKAVTWDESKFIAAGTAGHILYANNHDLVITGDFITTKVREGEIARYQLTITNIGMSTAKAASYSEELPRISGFLAVTTTRGSCSYSQDLTCQLGDMARGDTATITVDVTAIGLGTLLHTPTVLANLTDSDQANNTIVIQLDSSRGNSDSGGAAISYLSLVGLLCLRLYLMLNARRQDNRSVII